MKLKIPYDKKYLEFEIPLPEENITILECKDPSPMEDLKIMIKYALKNPIGSKRLSEIVHSNDKVALMFDDWTRPTPISKIIPIVLEEIKKGGVKDENIILICGNGMHNPKYMTEERLIKKLGKEIFSRYNVISHDAYDYEQQKFLGVSKTLGTPLFINKAVAEADIKVAIGKISPHGDVGYSGGSKMIMPGVSYVWSIIHNHSCSYPYTGMLKNPLREDIEECGQMAGLDFIINVVYNSKEEVLRVFAGDPVKAQRKGVEFGDMNVWGVKITEKADIVIISPSMILNYDEYFISSLKSIEIAEKCLKPGGTIIVIATCNQGWSRKEYLDSGWRVTKDILNYDYPGLLRLICSRTWHEPHRQFQALVYYVQHLAKICFDKNVILVGSKGFTEEDAKKLNIKFYNSIDEAINISLKKGVKEDKIILIPDSFILPLERFHIITY